MRRIFGIGAATLGVLGTLVCAAAIGLGWWAAVKAADRTKRVAARLEDGLHEADDHLSRVEERLAAARAEVDDVRGEAERLSAENPELPRVRAAVGRLLDRLLAAVHRAAALADALRPVAIGLRAAADVVTQLDGEVGQPGRARTAADAIDRAGEALNVPQARIEAVKSATAVRLTRELVELAREAAAGSERLAAGFGDARREIESARGRVIESRDKIVFWVYAAAAAHTHARVWVGLGQLCLVGWGRRSACPRLARS